MVKTKEYKGKNILSIKQKKTISAIIKSILVVIGVILLIIIFYSGDLLPSSGTQAGTHVSEGETVFHFIDVGQGDATLVVNGETSILIDCGTTQSSSYLCEYVKAYTKNIDYMILTHPHEDHMGGASEILSKINVSNLIMTDVSADVYYYDKFLDEAEKLKEKGKLSVITAVAGSSYECGDINFTLLAPNSDYYENANNSSIAVRVETGNVSALFTGDCEADAENELLTLWGDYLDSDIYQAGHHGSSTSNTDEFVRKVSPTYAVISCGEGNSYGHPHSSVLDTFRMMSVNVLRTDKDGNIRIITDGESITVD